VDSGGSVLLHPKPHAESFLAQSEFSNAVIAVAELAQQAALTVALRLFPASLPTFDVAFSVLMRTAFHQNFMACWIILGIEHAVRYYRGYQERQQHELRLELQAAELKAQLLQAQLSALSMQLQPHFLFNTLNAVMGCGSRSKPIPPCSMPTCLISGCSRLSENT
jgi:hypothetical protein